MLRFAAIIFAVAALWLGAATAQQQSPDVPDNTVTAASQSTQTDTSGAAGAREGTPFATGREDIPVGYITYKTPFEWWLVLLTVATLAITILALVVMGWRTGMSAEFNQSFIIVVIVFAALFLIAAGYSDKQAAPVYGLLGTIVGYIFGRMTDGKKRSDTDDPVLSNETADRQNTVTSRDGLPPDIPERTPSTTAQKGAQ